MHTLLRDLNVKNLDYIFSPPGLPLLAKTPDGAPTVTILVRGKAGTGKTTLALAIALAISAEGRGRTLYLSTEISPADVAWKLRQYELPVSTAAFFDEATEEDLVLVNHLGAMSDKALEKPEVRMEAALEAVWDMARRVPSGPALRCVVIDAFSLAGAHPSSDLRGVLLETLTALESQGISVILVEEAPPPSADWNSFLVDVVFEVSWAEDPDTGNLIRKLACPKSRQARARPGPHDYGLMKRSLAAWPAVSEILPNEFWGGEMPAELARDAQCLLQHGSDVLMVEPESLIACRYNAKEGTSGVVLLRSPWLKSHVLNCGTWMMGPRADINVNEGPDCVAWDYVSSLKEHGHPSIISVQATSCLLHRRRYRVPFQDALAGMANLGFIVLVHDSNEAISQFQIPFNIVSGQGGFQKGHTVLVIQGYFSYYPIQGTLESMSLHPAWHGRQTNLSKDAESLSVAGRHKSAVSACSLTIAEFGFIIPISTLITWAGMNAIHTESMAPLRWLLERTDPNEVHLATHFILPALAKRGMVQELDTLLQDRAGSLPPWHVRLIRGISFLYAPQELAGPAAADLRLLAKDSTIPQPTRATILHDVALYERRQSIPTWSATLAGAKELAPDLIPDEELVE